MNITEYNLKIWRLGFETGRGNKNAFKEVFESGFHCAECDFETDSEERAQEHKNGECPKYHAEM